MEHVRSNAPSPANVPSPLPPPARMLRTISHLNTDSTEQDNSSRDTTSSPAPNLLTVTPPVFVINDTSPTTAAGRSPLNPTPSPLSEHTSSIGSNFTTAGPITQEAMRMAPGLQTQTL